MYILLSVNSYTKTVLSNYLKFNDNKLYLNYMKLSHELNSPIKLSIKQNQKVYKLINKLFLNKSANYLLDITCIDGNIVFSEEYIITKIQEPITEFHVMNKRERKKLYDSKLIGTTTYDSKLYGISTEFDNKYSHRITETFERWFISVFGYYNDSRKNYFELCEASLLAYYNFR